MGIRRIRPRTTIPAGSQRRRDMRLFLNKQAVTAGLSYSQMLNLVKYGQASIVIDNPAPPVNALTFSGNVLTFGGEVLTFG